MKFRGPLDLAEVQEGYSGSVQRFYAQEGQNVEGSWPGSLYYSRDRLSGS
jgi:hypothetical protein